MCTVRFADTIQDQRKGSASSQMYSHSSPIAISFSEHHQPISILKTRSTPFPTAPGDPVREGAPPPEAVKQPEDEEVDTEESNVMRKLAALQAVKRAKKGQLKQDLAAVQEELELTRKDLENVRFREKITMQARHRAVLALEDVNKRMEASQAGLKEVLLANGELETKLGIADEQVEKLERELAIVRRKKSEMEN